MARQTELLKGTLDLLILRSLELEPRHGLGIAERIEQVTRGTFIVKPGSLFPALHRLERQGFIDGEWILTPAGKRAPSAPHRESWGPITMSSPSCARSSTRPKPSPRSMENHSSS